MSRLFPFLTLLLAVAAIAGAAVRWNEILPQPAEWDAAADRVLLHPTECGGWPAELRAKDYPRWRQKHHLP